MYIVILITCANKKEAKNISLALVKSKLAACINMLDNINSFFWWKGSVDSSSEVLLMVKSRKSLFSKVIKLVKSRHSYDVPEIIALPIIAGERRYLKWIKDSCLNGSKRK